MEDTAHQQQKLISAQVLIIDVTDSGLFVSLDNPSLAATPDGIIRDPSDITSSSGILGI